jgi:cardiolipin synthase
MKRTILRYLPNIITAFRLAAVPPVALLLWFGEYSSALVLFAIAGVSDGVDGYLARRFNWKSHWGAVMDPLADKLLLVTTAAILTFKDLLPIWLFVLVMGRDIMIVGGAALYRWCFGPFEVRPSVLGKLSTFIQILLVLSLLVHVATGLLTNEQIHFMILMCAFITLLSGVHYLFIWVRKAINE